MDPERPSGWFIAVFAAALLATIGIAGVAGWAIIILVLHVTRP